MFTKDFDRWAELKKTLHFETIRPQFEERDIWWCSLGVNVGFEVDGKNKDDRRPLFLRPVLVLRKLSKETFIGIPLTTRQKRGSWYMPIVVSNKQVNLIFSQIKVFDAKRMHHLLEKVAPPKFKEVKNNFKNFL
jgi:mRNA-degrading endonuclease toxin of MazEF toxin-antitoxin module